MLEKLKEIALRYEDLQAQLADPGVYGDAVRLRNVTRELKELEPVVAAYHAWKTAKASREDAEKLLHDPDLRELAQEELTAARLSSAVGWGRAFFPCSSRGTRLITGFAR